MPDGQILEFNEDNFDEQVQNSSRAILVDFWASWCAPCKEIAPALKELAAELKERASIARVDVDDNGDLANRFGILSVPTLMVFRGGRVVDQLVGAVPKEQIRKLLEKHL